LKAIEARGLPRRLLGHLLARVRDGLRLLRGLLRCRLHFASPLFATRGLGGALPFGFLAHLQPFFFDCLIDPLPRFFANLCPRR
jgi:hypothetical protein